MKPVQFDEDSYEIEKRKTIILTSHNLPDSSVQLSAIDSLSTSSRLNREELVLENVDFGTISI